MKVIEIISEGAKDEHRLQLIAKHLMRKIKKEITTNKKSRAEKMKSGQGLEKPLTKMGYIRDIVPKKVLGHLFNRLGRVNVDVDYSTSENQAGGYFDSGDNTVEVMWPKNSNEQMDEIESYIVHELRHALDSSFSSGFALHSKPKDKTPIGDEMHPLNRSHEEYGGGDYEYLASPDEINARFSQVQRNITKLIKRNMRTGKPLSIQDFMKQLYQLLHNEALGEIYPTNDEKENALRKTSRAIAGKASEIPSKPLDSKDYQQLLKRAIKYFDSEKQRLTKNSK